MIQIENSFFDLAQSTERNCLVICDRGAMDASAFISREQWEHILARNGLDEVEIRDNRYSQVSLTIFETGNISNHTSLQSITHIMFYKERFIRNDFSTSQIY